MINPLVCMCVQAHSTEQNLDGVAWRQAGHGKSSFLAAVTVNEQQVLGTKRWGHLVLNPPEMRGGSRSGDLAKEQGLERPGRRPHPRVDSLLLGVFPNRREFDAVWGAARNIGRDVPDCSRQPPAFDFGLQNHPQCRQFGRDMKKKSKQCFLLYLSIRAQGPIST